MNLQITRSGGDQVLAPALASFGAGRLADWISGLSEVSFMPAYLLSGLRFSTAVWVWLVVRMETCSPSGPLAVEMTSYSEETTTKSWSSESAHTTPKQENRKCSSVDIFELIASYRWCHYPSSPSPGWRRMGIPPPSPQWGWRAETWVAPSRLPRRVHLRGSSWGRRWWNTARLASCPSGRQREALWEEEGFG